MRQKFSLSIVACLIATFLVAGLLQPVIEAEGAQSSGMAYSFRYPLENYTKNTLDNFGEDRGNGVWHLGNDISGPAGTSVFAIGDGVVQHTGVLKTAVGQGDCPLGRAAQPQEHANCHQHCDCRSCLHFCSPWNTLTLLPRTSRDRS